MTASDVFPHPGTDVSTLRPSSVDGLDRYPPSGRGQSGWLSRYHAPLAREEVPHPLADAREWVRPVGGSDRLLAEMVGAPQQEADRRRESRVADLVHEPAGSLRRAGANRHLERVACEG